MRTVAHVIEIPLPTLREQSEARLTGSNTADSMPLSGTLYQGHTGVFAKLQRQADGNVTLRFSIKVHTVTRDAFENWRRAVTQMLGPALEKKIARRSGFFPDEVVDISAYALAVFFSVFNHAPKDAKRPEKACFRARNQPQQAFLNSIYALETSVQTFEGQLIATPEVTEVRAYIPASYFQFAGGVVTPFVSYAANIVLLSQNTEFKTRPGVLNLSPS